MMLYNMFPDLCGIFSKLGEIVVLNKKTKVATYLIFEIICSKWRSFVFIQVTMLLKCQSIGVLSQRGSIYKQVCSFLNYGARFFAVPRALKMSLLSTKVKSLKKIVKNL